MSILHLSHPPCEICVATKDQKLLCLSDVRRMSYGILIMDTFKDKCRHPKRYLKDKLDHLIKK